MSCNPKLRSSLMREYAYNLIKDEVIPDLFENRQIKKLLKSYMQILKVQLHRCRNPELMSRT